MTELDLAYEAKRSLKRIRPQIDCRIEEVRGPYGDVDVWTEVIEARMSEHWQRFFGLLHRLYGHHYDFFYYLQNITLTAVDCWLERPDDLNELDRRRELDPGWHHSERMVGGSLYVDLFAGDLVRLRERIPYFQELGLTFLHLMPLFASRPGNSDGGYAISDYRAVDPDLGTIDDLRALAAACRKAGISLVLDFVFNHTSDDHAWAIRAQEGDREHMDYYHLYKDRTIPDQYERTLREIFPTVHRGNFTWHPGMQRWVWTSFNTFQWDLKYANPEVFRAMCAEMLFLANTGVEILRLDAVAFIWKEMGTSCENLPEAHLLIQAFNALCRIAAPGLVFKSEAIVHPDEVRRYIGRGECQLSYNPSLMALLWESIATRETQLLRQSLSHRQSLPSGTAWVNYLRCHDDIGWAFDNGDAETVGIKPDDHREFLNRFYTGRFEGSFSTGIPFQHNEDTGDMRISGTAASLAGLEQALEKNDSVLADMALRRLYLLYGVLCSIGGNALIFLGEEWAVLNDYTYLKHPDKADDSRWVHRPKTDWKLYEKEVRRPGTLRHRHYEGLRELFRARKHQRALKGASMRLLPCDNIHVLGYLREQGGHRMAVLANFSDREQEVNLSAWRKEGLAHYLKDVFTGRTVSTHDAVSLPPYELLWLEED
ncbi:MAG: amylosucrase [Spartobacteria bacterium]|nr:amylosucrase [Spartobacteria bacterium]